MSQRVIALRTGFIGGVRRREGDIFRVSDKVDVKKTKWFELYEKTSEKETSEDTSGLASKTYNELMKLAGEKGLTFETRPKKPDLVVALNAILEGTPDDEVDAESTADGEGTGQDLA